MPHPGLIRWVEFYQYFEKNADEEVFSGDLIMPEPGPIAALFFDGTWQIAKSPSCCMSPLMISAALRESLPVHLEGHSRAIFIHLKPGGSEALRLFTIASIGGVCAWADRSAESLYERLATTINMGCFDDIPRSIDQFLLARSGHTCSYHLEKVCNTISQAISGPFDYSVRELASDVGVSPRSLERYFRMLTGYSPVDFRNVARCSMARSILWNKEDSGLTDMALGLGFWDLPHFSRVFRRYVNLSPGGYIQFCKPFRNHMTGPCEMAYHEKRSSYFNGIEKTCNPK